MVQAIQVLRFHLLELEKVRKTTTTTKFIPSTYCSILLLLLLLVSPISSISSKYVNYVHVLPRLTDRHMMVTCAPPISNFLRRYIHIHILLLLFVCFCEWIKVWDGCKRWTASCFIAFLDFGSNHFMHLHFSLFIKSTTTTKNVSSLPFCSLRWSVGRCWVDARHHLNSFSWAWWNDTRQINEYPTYVRTYVRT